jgi:hypothetical protein
MVSLAFSRRLLLLVGMMCLTSVPALAQIDVAGEWARRLHEDQPRRGPGPHVGDFLGVPLNDAARQGAEAWDASILSLLEHQTHQYTSTLNFYAPTNVRISRVVDADSQQLVAYEIEFSLPAGLAPRTIWMDGRSHPSPYAPHTWAGFSTGRWNGPLLTVETSHLKKGYLTRAGIRHTDHATLVEHFVRHGADLTVVSIVDDPDTLDEPFVQSRNYVLDPDQQFPPRTQYLTFIDGVADRAYVPHYLPGQNPFLREFAALFGLPYEATRGGRNTMYPEYQRQLRERMELNGR